MNSVEISIDRLDVAHDRLSQAKGILSVLMMNSGSEAQPSQEVMNCALWGVLELVNQAHGALN